MSGPDDHGDGLRPAVESPQVVSVTVQLEIRVPAEPRAVGTVRSQVRGWLTALNWPLNDLDDLLLAINEACTKAVEHAYLAGAAGDVMISLRVATGGTGLRQVNAVVRDCGHWRTAPADPGFRGHGLTMMRELTQLMRIRRDHRGTSVTMTSRPVPIIASPDRRSSGRSIALGRAGCASVSCSAVSRVER